MRKWLCKFEAVVVATFIGIGIFIMLFYALRAIMTAGSAAVH